MVNGVADMGRRTLGTFQGMLFLLGMELRVLMGDGTRGR